MSKVYALIPARGGSKRLKRKNIREFLGKPMIWWSIQAAKQASKVDEVWVSSEDPEILGFSGVHCRTLVRPKELAEDHVWTRDVVAHFIEEVDVQPEDIIVVVQANSPEVEPYYINMAVGGVKDGGLWESHSVDKHLINNGAIHAFRAKVNEHRGKANYNGVIKTNYVDVHTEEDLKMSEENKALALATDLYTGGFISIPGFWSEGECDDLAGRVRSFWVEERAKGFPGGNYMVSPPDANLDKGLLKKGKSVLNLRGSRGYDENMIDMLYAERMFPEIKKLQEEPLIKAIKFELENMNERNLNFARYHLYLNESATSTRGFHRDSDKPGLQYKAFIYLTDVPDKSYGPYCYKQNTLTSSKGEATVCTATKGTLIMSDQYGLHRGFPQESGKHRIMLVLNIFDG